jgi:hypothetical protein
MAGKPVHEVRYGLIKASIWRNQTKQGTRFTVSITRLFKNGDLWQESTRFGRDDLLLLAKVAGEAHTWICQDGQCDGLRSVGRASRAVGCRAAGPRGESTGDPRRARPMSRPAEGVIRADEAYSKKAVLVRLGISQKFWDRMLDEGLPYTVVGHTRWVTGQALITHLHQHAERKRHEQTVYPRKD